MKQQVKKPLPNNPADLVLLGAITGAQGLKGEVVMQVFTGDPQDIMSYGPLQSEDGSTQVQIEGLRPLKSGFAARLKGVTDRNGAEALKGIGLYVSREALGEAEEEDEFFQADLIGLEVRQGDAAIGRVKAVQDFGAGDLLEIQLTGKKGTVLLPFTLEAVPEVSISGGFVRVSPPEGLWDDPRDHADERAKEEG